MPYSSRWMIAVFITILALLLPKPVIAQPVEGDRALKVGLILPLSGPAASYGIACRNGFEMAREEGLGQHLEAIYEDDQFMPAKTVSAFKKLVLVDKVDVIISIGSTNANAIAPLAEKEQILMFAWAGDPKVSAGKRFVINQGRSSELEGEMIAKETARKGYQKVALVTATGDYQESINVGFKRVFPERQLVFVEEIPRETADFRVVLLKAKSAGAQALALCLHPGQHGLLAKQAWQIGFRPAFMGCDNMQGTEEGAIAQGALDDGWFVAQMVTPQFRSRYLEKFKQQDVVIGAAIQYETAKVLAELAPKKERGAELIEALVASPAREGAVGKYQIVRDGDRQYMDIPLVVSRVAGKPQ